MRRRAFLGLTTGSFLAGSLRTQISGDKSNQTPRRLATGCAVADPFCVKRQDGWYLTGTQHAAGIEDRRFSLFFSADLQAWQDLGPVLVRPQYEGSGRANYWAPEFIENAGTFYFYYTADSFGDPERRFVRVATSNKVSGPSEDLPGFGVRRCNRRFDVNFTSRERMQFR